MLNRLRSGSKSLGPNEGTDTRALRALRLVNAFEAEGAGWFWETDADGRIAYLSEHLREALSKAGGDPLGTMLPSVFTSDPNGPTPSRTLQFQLAARSGFKNFAVRSDARPPGTLWYMSGQPRYDERGMFQGFTGAGSDMTDRRRSEAAIARLAYSDTLTGLANRERMHATLEHLLETRQSGFTPTALLLLDLDRFKAVNDTLGHQTGDKLLKQVASRLEQVIGPAGFVGRLGGDEFQVILAHNNARADAETVASTVIQSLGTPFVINDTTIEIGCSVGIAVAPEQGKEVETLVRNADLALYAAKDAGRNTYKTYHEKLLTDATRRKRMEDDLRKALAAGQLRVVYQPVVSTQTATIVGYEALLRWDHPIQGSISPAEFIPVAEESGLIHVIGEWVLRTAIADCAGWPNGLRVAVNVSPIQFANADLTSIVANALARAMLRPDQLEIEVTEGVFLSRGGDTDRTFRGLQALGVRLALDDFGTGYSSFGYLQEAPFNKIKIDQSFVRGAIIAGNRNAAIIKAIVTLASDLGMETTAEGVEQQDEIAFVRQLGCSHIQGFVYGQPCSNDALINDIAIAGLHATPVGHKISREPRERVLLRARIVRGGFSEEGVVRNISSRGAMIECAALSDFDVGLEVAVELFEGSPWIGVVRWVSDGRAGVRFARERVR